MASVPQISDLKHVFPILITFTTTHSMSSSCHFGVDFWDYFWVFFQLIHPPPWSPQTGHPKQPTLPPNGRIHSHPPNLSGPALTNYKVLVVQSPKPSPLAPWSVYAGNIVGCAPHRATTRPTFWGSLLTNESEDEFPPQNAWHGREGRYATFPPH